MNDPTLWYSNQYLLEKEPGADPANLVLKLTKAAEEARRAVGASVTSHEYVPLTSSLAQKREVPLTNRKPMKAITQEWLATRRNKRPVLLCGWPFNGHYFLEYAKRHSLSVKLSWQTLQRLGFPTEVSLRRHHRGILSKSKSACNFAFRSGIHLSASPEEVDWFRTPGRPAPCSRMGQ